VTLRNREVKSAPMGVRYRRVSTGEGAFRGIV
jgi:hypothetical protein